MISSSPIVWLGRSYQSSRHLSASPGHWLWKLLFWCKMLLVALSYRYSPPAPYLASYIRFGIPTKLSSAWQVFSCINWYHSSFWGYKFAFAVTQLLVLWSVFLNMIKAGVVISWRIDFFFSWGSWGEVGKEADGVILLKPVLFLYPEPLRGWGSGKARESTHHFSLFMFRHQGLHFWVP